MRFSRALALSSACLSGMVLGSAAPASTGVRFTKEQQAIVHVAPDRLFPLLCPVREYDWIPDWRCDLVYSGSGVVEQDCIFITQFKDEGPSVWITTLHDPATRRVAFVRVISGKGMLKKLDIQVQEAEGGNSRLLWRESFTGLSKEGNAQLAKEAALGWKASELNFRRVVELLEHHLVNK